MIAKSLLPQTFWFRFALPCRRFDSMPLPQDRARLLDLPAAAALPSIQLDGQPSWAEVRVGWNSRGLGIAVLADGTSRVQLDRHRPEGFAAAQFWIDTRDTRDVSRATRFCHRFVAALEVGKSAGELTARVDQKPIARAIADAPLCRSEVLSATARLGQSSWVLELFLPAQALQGFDPDTNRRLGFAYQLTDHVRDDQFLGVGRDFPVGENPSLWGTLELRDEAGNEPARASPRKGKGV